MARAPSFRSCLSLSRREMTETQVRASREEGEIRKKGGQRRTRRRRPLPTPSPVLRFSFQCKKERRKGEGGPSSPFPKARDLTWTRPEETGGREKKKKGEGGGASDSFISLLPPKKRKPRGSVRRPSPTRRPAGWERERKKKRLAGSFI